jgi:hypothetical protein
LYFTVMADDGMRWPMRICSWRAFRWLSSVVAYSI